MGGFVTQNVWTLMLRWTDYLIYPAGCAQAVPGIQLVAAVALRKPWWLPPILLQKAPRAQCTRDGLQDPSQFAVRAKMLLLWGGNGRASS